MQRRHFMKLALMFAAGGWLSAKGLPMAHADDELGHSDWKDKLTSEQYRVMREKGTERPFSSEHLHETREGVYVCAACGQPLFYTGAKFDSGTGWPSFDKVIKGSIETKTDYELFMPRTEYHCAKCGSHLGHVFNDGPTETGQRYCNNGIALRFVAKGTPEYDEIVKKYPPQE